MAPARVSIVHFGRMDTGGAGMSVQLEGQWVCVYMDKILVLDMYY